MDDWKPFKPFNLPTGSGKGADKVLGDKALFAMGGSEGFRTRIVPLPTGGQMRVQTRNGMPEYIYEPGKTNVAQPVPFAVKMDVLVTLKAKLLDIYMTSGAFTFGSLGGVNQTDPLLTVEPVTYKTGEVSGGETPLIPLYDKPPPDNADVSKIYNHTVSPGGLNSPKLAMLGSVPSKFSGLMRRCMQARYGSGNTSQDMVREEDSALGSVFVGSDFNRTTGILKFGIKYLFVAITSGGGGMYIDWWPLAFPQEYEDMLIYDTPAFETLALSHAYVIPDTKVQLGNFDIAYGTPIYYGWNFSLTTNNAVCCINDPLAYGYDRRMYYLMTLGFTYDDFTNELTANYALDETVDGWIVPGSAPIWSPFGAETIWYNKRATSPAPTTNQDFPVHAYYVGDALKLVRWKWAAATVAYSEAVWLAKVKAADMATSYFGEGSASYFVDYAYGSTVTHGFYEGSGVPLTSASQYKSESRQLTTVYGPGIYPYSYPLETVSFSTDCEFDWWMTLYDNSFNPRLSYSPNVYTTPSPTDPHPGNHYSSVVRRSVSSSGGYEGFTGAAAHLSALVIPEADCSMVYIGTSRTFDAGSRTTTTFSGGSYGTAKVEEYNVLLIRHPVTGVFDHWELGGYWYPPVEKQFVASGVIALGVANGPVNTSNTTSTAKFDRDISLYRTSKETVGTLDSEIFHPSIIVDTLSQQVQAISSSLYGDARYNNETLIGTTAATSGYPMDITLFIGAS